jgi:hypothetical protein
MSATLIKPINQLIVRGGNAIAEVEVLHRAARRARCNVLLTSLPVVGE